jgi:putative PIN family toxin of toxin-antitoxin system
LTRAVIDTNVWVAGVPSADGPPARVVDAALIGLVVPVLSPAILAEYEDVLHRRELSLPLADVEAILTYLRLPGEHVIQVDPTGVERVCVDPDDDMFLAAAVEGGAAFVVTGNRGHFPRGPWRGIRIIEPRGFVELIEL